MVKGKLMLRLAECCPPTPRVQFKASTLDQLVNTVDFYTTAETGILKPRRWESLAAAKETKKACETVIASARLRGIAFTEAERLLKTINGEIAYYQRILGVGDRAKLAWHRPCRVISGLVLKTLQSADRLAKRKIRTKFSTRMIDLIRDLLAPICALNKEKLPTAKTIRNILAGPAD
jgi:hypothetical protein